MNKQNKLYEPAQIRTYNMGSLRSTDLSFPPDEPSLTQQQFVKECDINFIVAQSEKTGFVNHVNSQQPIWDDFGDSVDYQSALNYIQEAQNAFMGLDAHVRDRFANDPAKLLDFMNDPKNESEARALGLLNPLPETQPEPPLGASKGKKTPTSAPSSGDE